MSDTGQVFRPTPTVMVAGADGLPVPAANELQEAWDATFAETEQARLPVARVPFGFMPAKIEDVTFIVAVIQQTRQTAENIQAQADAMIAVAERYAEMLKRHYTPAIAEIMRGELAGGKAKSLKLVTGVGPEPTKCGFRTVPGGLRIEDEEKAVEWAKEFADDPDTMLTVKTIIKPVAAAFKAHFAASGEIPDGCIIQESEERFYIS